MTSSKPSIVVEIPKKTADYYRDFQEVNLALLLREDIYPFDNLSLEVLLASLENTPRTYKQAVLCPLKNVWLNAMGQEVTELEDQDCWDLVDLPEGKTALGGRWVYTTKTDSKGNVVRYKARWVAQGYNQTLGIDYLETFLTTIRLETYRLFLALALQNS